MKSVVYRKSLVRACCFMLPFVLVIFRAFPLTAGKYMRHAGDMGRVRTGAGTKKHQVALAVSKRMQSELRGPLEATGGRFLLNWDRGRAFIRAPRLPLAVVLLRQFHF